MTKISMWNHQIQYTLSTIIIYIRIYMYVHTWTDNTHTKTRKWTGNTHTHTFLSIQWVEMFVRFSFTVFLFNSPIEHDVIFVFEHIWYICEKNWTENGAKKNRSSFVYNLPIRLFHTATLYKNNNKKCTPKSESGTPSTDYFVWPYMSM